MAGSSVGNRYDIVTVETPRASVEVVRQQWRSQRPGSRGSGTGWPGSGAAGLAAGFDAARGDASGHVAASPEAAVMADGGGRAGEGGARGLSVSVVACPPCCAGLESGAPALSYVRRQQYPPAGPRRKRGHRVRWRRPACASCRSSGCDFSRRAGVPRRSRPWRVRATLVRARRAEQDRRAVRGRGAAGAWGS